MTQPQETTCCIILFTLKSRIETSVETENKLVFDWDWCGRQGEDGDIGWR